MMVKEDIIFSLILVPNVFGTPRQFLDPPETSQYEKLKPLKYHVLFYH